MVQDPVFTIHDLLVSSLQDHPEFRHGIFPVISKTVDDGTAPTIRFRSYKKKHMVTVLYIHHQAATYLAKQLTFSMGTGDSLELSVTVTAPANSATDGRADGRMGMTW